MKIMYIGLGRIGLPQALVSADCGHSVFGFDKNTELTSSLKEARAPFFEPSMYELLSKHIGKNFKIINEINIAPADIDLVFFTGTPARRADFSLLPIAYEYFPSNVRFWIKMKIPITMIMIITGIGIIHK